MRFFQAQRKREVQRSRRAQLGRIEMSELANERQHSRGHRIRCARGAQQCMRAAATAASSGACFESTCFASADLVVCSGCAELSWDSSEPACVNQGLVPIMSYCALHCVAGGLSKKETCFWCDSMEVTMALLRAADKGRRWQQRGCLPQRCETQRRGQRACRPPEYHCGANREHPLAQRCFVCEIGQRSL